MTWSRPWARTAASPSPRSRGSAPSLTSRSRHFVTGRWPSSRSAMSSSTPPTASPASITGWSPRPSWSRPVSRPMGAARCSASTSATARTARSGPRPARAQDPRPARRPAGHLRRPRRAQGRDPGRAARRRVESCWVHFLRTVFAQPDAAHVRSQLDVIAGMLGGQHAKVETMLREARTLTLRPSPRLVIGWFAVRVGVSAPPSGPAIPGPPAAPRAARWAARWACPRVGQAVGALACDGAASGVGSSLAGWVVEAMMTLSLPASLPA